MEKRSLLPRIFLRESFQQSTLLTLGTATNSLLGLAFYLLIARSLGPAGFGYFSFILGLGIMASEVFDLGLASALVRFGTGVKFTAVFSLVFWERIIVGTGLFIVAWGLKFVNTAPYEQAAAAGASLLLVSLVTQGFLAKQKYGWYVTTNLFGNFTRLGIILTLIYSGRLSAINGLLAFSGANLVAFLLGLIVILAIEKERLVIRAAVGVFKEVFSYSRFLALSFGLASVASKIDIPVVYLLGGGAAAGIYSSAQKLVSVVPQVAAAVDGVFGPKFARNDNFNRYFREYFILVVGISLGLLVLIPFSGFLIPAIFGVKYISATGVFSVLVISLIPLFLGGPPAAAILYRFGKSNYHLFISAGQLAGSLALYLFLIPIIGAVGAALTAVIVNLGGAVSYYYFYRRCWSL